MGEGLRALEVVKTYRRRFEAEMKTISCRELTGTDLSTEQEVARYMRSDIPQTVCFPAVGFAYKLVKDLLNEVMDAKGC